MAMAMGPAPRPGGAGTTGALYRSARKTSNRTEKARCAPLEIAAWIRRPQDSSTGHALVESEGAAVTHETERAQRVANPMDCVADAVQARQTPVERRSAPLVVVVAEALAAVPMDIRFLYRGRAPTNLFARNRYDIKHLVGLVRDMRALQLVLRARAMTASRPTRCPSGFSPFPIRVGMRARPVGKCDFDEGPKIGRSQRRTLRFAFQNAREHYPTSQ